MAVTEKVAVVPCDTVLDCGCDEIIGALFVTVSTAALLVTVPSEFDTIQR